MYMYIHMYVCTYVCIYIQRCMYIHNYMHIHVYINTFISPYILHTYKCMHTCICIYMYLRTCMYICTHMYMYLRTCMYHFQIFNPPLKELNPSNNNNEINKFSSLFKQGCDPVNIFVVYPSISYIIIYSYIYSFHKSSNYPLYYIFIHCII